MQIASISARETFLVLTHLHVATDYLHLVEATANTRRHSASDMDSSPHRRQVAGLGMGNKQHSSSGVSGKAGDGNRTGVTTPSSAKSFDAESFSDMPLVVTAFQQEGVASRISRKGLAGLQAASDACVAM